VTIALDGSNRQIQLGGEHLNSLRLAYAQHVYRQQGATVERTIVLTGGWQTSKETAYVEATRARHGTDWHIARDQLGEEGQDPGRIRRFAELTRSSRRQVPSLDYSVFADDVQPGWIPSRDPLRLDRMNPLRALARALARPRESQDEGRSR
jgi:hypothetical protein